VTRPAANRRTPAGHGHGLHKWKASRRALEQSTQPTAFPEKTLPSPNTSHPGSSADSLPLSTAVPSQPTIPLDESILMDTLGMQRTCREHAENMQRRPPILVMEAEDKAFRAVLCFCNAPRVISCCRAHLHCKPQRLYVTNTQILEYWNTGYR
jgi:hypothetical protein